jgi:hypothetical protein
MSEADLRQIVNQPDREEFYALLGRIKMYNANRVEELDGIF